MSYHQTLLYQIGLTLVKGIGNITAKQVLECFESPEAFFREKRSALEKIPGITTRVVDEVHNPEVLKRAEKEILFIEKNQITPLFITESNYPRRFKDCADSPVMMYYRGNADLNAGRIVSVVGTRNASVYGKETTESFIHDLQTYAPDMLIVSGLAYGIDIIAHRSALRGNLSTVGVLAHGLDRIYPYSHRETAAEMINRGGLLTDFLSETIPDRQNFVKRNRIIAGLADCTLVIESAAKGGALITAHIADSYNRDVFAVPGRRTDAYSEGCNRLIKDRKASLVGSAEDLLNEMRWLQGDLAIASQPVQRELFVDLSPEGQAVVDILRKTENMHLNLLAIEMNLPVSKLSVLLFDLEMNGVVRCLPGGMYRL